ncbi:twin-arginine translocase subunit TatC [Halorarius litoreus]|uniref:twin-arginine translocase subunit TatC n=1 Tax=Halorarius litoreus TaxID=2962676 RepID=UPI0020CE0EDE|nr:twin-arginine translocase subunit TatC [Halorarius litoreus]
MSGAIDEDVANTVMDGRETLGAMLRAAQKHLQKVFILFVIGLIATIYFLRAFGWARMKADLLAQAPDADIVAVTPFDVILLQVKIGLVVGILLALPLLLYYSRDALKERGIWPRGVPRWKIAVAVLMSILLLLGGAAYGYLLFFPLAFEFLSSNAVQAGFQPNYSIVKWAQFVFLLSISFGLAAQLPLAMAGLSLSGIVPYQTFRDYWKHAIVGLYAIGALFTPPDPLTQVMWATPLVFLYGFSLSLTKFLVNAQQAGERIDSREVFRDHWNRIAGVGVVAAAVVFFIGRALTNGAADAYLPRIDSVALVGPYLDTKIPDALATSTLFGVDATVALAVAALGVGVVTGFLALVYLMFKALDELVAAEGGLGGPAPASTGSPGDIDVGELNAAGVRAAPPEAFADMTEQQALSLASAALGDGDDMKAEAILDRFDEAQELVEADPVEKGATASAANNIDEDGNYVEPAPDEEEEGNVFSRTGAGMLSAFTEDEVDEDDIGGYYYDIAFIASSLSSKAFRIIGTFMTVLAVVFYVLYTGGIGRLRDQFLRKLPDQVVADQVDIVALHPVEALIFEIKVATIAGAVAALPVLLYYAWPALKERGLARGDRRVLGLWGGSILVTLVAGSLFGFLYVAPTIISYLAADAIQAHMVIAYRINNFGWLVFFTTIGVGLISCIPVTMWLFHAGGLLRYDTFVRRWREVTISVFALVALLSPRGVFMMFLIGIPVMAMYGLGLAVLWVVTLGGRRGGGKPTVEPASD